MTSVIDSSWSSGSSGPKPVTSLTISSTRRARSSRVTAKLCFVTTRSTIPSILAADLVGRRIEERVERADDLGLEDQADLAEQLLAGRRAGRRSHGVEDRHEGGRRRRGSGRRAMAGWSVGGRVGGLLRSFDSLEQRHRLGSPLARDVTHRAACPGERPNAAPAPQCAEVCAEHNSTIAEVRCGVATELMRSGRVGAGAEVGSRYLWSGRVRVRYTRRPAWGYSSAGRASEWHSEGQGFESP